MVVVLLYYRCKIKAVVNVAEDKKRVDWITL